MAAHTDVLVQFYLPIVSRIYESRIEGTFKLVGLVLGSLDDEGKAGMSINLKFETSWI